MENYDLTDTAVPKRKTSGALSKTVKPSAALAAIVGAESLPRTEVVSKVWDHMRANACRTRSTSA